VREEEFVVNFNIIFNLFFVEDLFQKEVNGLPAIAHALFGFAKDSEKL
jgi:hypothetical protein